MNSLMGYNQFGYGQGGPVFASDLPMRSKSGGKQSAAWFSACQVFCVLQIGAGATLSISSFMFLFSFARIIGAVTAGMLIAVGTLGFFGARIRNRALLTFHAVGAILALVMLFEIVSMTARDKTVDCALAELHLRTKQLHESVSQSKDSVMFQAVYGRLNEMEEQLTEMEKDVARNVRSSHDKLHSRVQDTHLMAEKMEALKKHAEKFITQVHNNPNLTQSVINTLDTDVRNDISSRIEKAHKIMQRVEGFERATDKTSAINFAEYEHLVQSLIDVVTRPNPSGLLSAPLQQQQELFRMRHGLPDMAAALGRLLTHKEEQDSAHTSLEATWREREERRESWNEHFAEIVSSHFSHLPSLDVLGDMPEHCMKETVANKVMLLLGTGIMVLQTLTVYFALNTLLSIPQKME